jgi:hypothetical protein
MGEKFFTKIVGVTKANSDGSDRQEIIGETLGTGDMLDLKREPNNRYDRNAIAIYYYDDQIGYLSANVAKELAPLMDSHWLILATVVEITGGSNDRPYGVNIEIEKLSPQEVALEVNAIEQKTSQQTQTIGLEQPIPAASVFTKTQKSHTSSRLKSDKSYLVTLLLCIFLGCFGIHRFYAGRGSWFFTLTLGYLGIGWIVDLIIIIFGKFKDGSGLPIKL